MNTSIFEPGRRLACSNSRLRLTLLHVKIVNFVLKRRHEDKKCNTVYARRDQTRVSVLMFVS